MKCHIIIPCGIIPFFYNVVLNVAIFFTFAYLANILEKISSLFLFFIGTEFITIVRFVTSVYLDKKLIFLQLTTK